MFQIEPIIWLQSFESPTLNWLMITVSNLGYTVVYSSLMIVLLFGFRLKQSLAVILAAFIVGIMTHALKEGLKFPRPSQVDVRVQEPGQEPIEPIIDKGGGTTFWSLPSKEALETVRAQPFWSYGWPSGHVSSATAFILGMAFFFRSKGLWMFSGFWISLMALSRIYLGRHFIGDVMGGFIVGVLGLIMAYWVLKPFILEKTISPKYSALVPLACLAIPLVLVAPFIPLIDNSNAGRITALLILYIYLIRVGFPSDQGTLMQRGGRVLVALVVFFSVDRLINYIMETSGWEDLPIVEILSTGIGGFVTFLITIKISRQLNFYKPSSG